MIDGHFETLSMLGKLVSYIKSRLTTTIGLYGYDNSQDQGKAKTRGL